MLGDYQDKLVELLQADSALNKTVPDSIRNSIEWLLRQVNCYYSNKIEGNPTHPKELLKAQAAQTGGEGSVVRSKAIQELLAHLEAQIKLAKKEVESAELCSPDFIKSLHKAFYSGLPKDQLHIKNLDGEDVLGANGEPLLIVPGEYREHGVLVGKHEPPAPEELNGYMKWLAFSFNPEKIHGTNRVIAAAALHHRLAWIHPFQDGNGRVIRLLTDCYMRHSGFGGYGLWSITRGFARDTKAYYYALAQADKVRQGGQDGRGILSDAGLLHFTKYYIDTALDQLRYFSDLLELRKLTPRIDYYFEMRAKQALPGMSGEELPQLKLFARDIYKFLLERGERSKSEICTYLGRGEQTLRGTFKQMDAEGLISISAKQKVKLQLSPNIIEYLFPKLW
ncbi:MAG: Fic family protein [Pseudomonas sp.]